MQDEHALLLFTVKWVSNLHVHAGMSCWSRQPSGEMLDELESAPADSAEAPLFGGPVTLEATGAPTGPIVLACVLLL